MLVTTHRHKKFSCTTMTSASSLSVTLSFQGQSVTLEGITNDITGHNLYNQAFQALGLSRETTTLKLLCQGKRIADNGECISLPNKKPLKILVMATSQGVVEALASQRSDPTIRGFDQEKKPLPASFAPWGPHEQDKNYKFCRFEACTWQSFGHRPTDTTPHDFRAMELLQTLAMDPGVVAVMKERELVVGTLGEMDPIDDRIMQKKQAEGACLLGYNTNAGTRIDIKLRTDDLKGFRPYPELVGTLLHELSHNWVGEHNLLFWTNYAQMRAEYLTTHRAMQSSLIHGKTTAELAGLNAKVLTRIPETIMTELVVDMAQHGLHPRMIEAPIRQRCDELEQQHMKGQTLGGGTSNVEDRASARERALAAAEKRRKQQGEPTQGNRGSDHQ